MSEPILNKVLQMEAADRVITITMPRTLPYPNITITGTKPSCSGVPIAKSSLLRTLWTLIAELGWEGGFG
jgi:hypothetical protein